MAYISKILDIDGTHSLTFYCGELPADEAVTEAGHEPNGYFWDRVATFVAGDLIARLELDSEGGMFSASGAASDLNSLQVVLEPLLVDGTLIAEVIRRAADQGFEFDD